MPDNRFDFVLINQTVSDGDGLFRLAGIITLNQLNLFAVDPTSGIDIFGGLSRPMPVLIAIGRVWPGERPCDANDDIRLGGKCRDQTTCYYKRKGTSE